MENVDINYFLESPQGRCLERHIKKNFPEFYDAIKDLPGTKWAEKIYRYFYPGSGMCVVCGAPTKFKSITEGFHSCCSKKCSGANPARLQKVSNTCLKRYGVPNPSSSELIKKKREQTCQERYGVKSGFCNRDKIKSTCLKRYGVPNPSSSELIKKKREQTCQERYGVPNPFGSEPIRAKSIHTKLERYGDAKYNNREAAVHTMESRYGVSNAFNIPGVFESGLDARKVGGAYKKVSQHNIDRCLERHPDILSINNGIFTCSCPHPDCGGCEEKQYNMVPGVYAYREKCGAEKCTILNPVGLTNSNTSIEMFVEKILKDCGIDYEKHNRKILGGREVDFFVPSKALAIECNGCYWHSDNFKNKHYHKRKFKNCLVAGIQLLTIWEDWVHNSPDKIKNLILSKLGIYGRTLYARKCEVREITAREAQRVLTYHMQGPGQASIRLGLYMDKELVSVMTFSISRAIYGGKNDSWELVRYCCVPKTRIVGGASKLLKYFISHFNPSKIVSFSSNDISIGSLYKTLKFTKKSITDSYWYIEPNTLTRHHRYVYRKSELVARGADPTKSEFEITDSMGLYRIWDSGQTRWELNL